MGGGVPAKNPKVRVHFFNLWRNYACYRKTYNGTLLRSQGRPFRKYQHDPCDFTPSPKKGGRPPTKLHFFDLWVNSTIYCLLWTNKSWIYISKNLQRNAIRKSETFFLKVSYMTPVTWPLPPKREVNPPQKWIVFNSRVNDTRFIIETLSGSQGRPSKKCQHNLCDLNPSPKKIGSTPPQNCIFSIFELTVSDIKKLTMERYYEVRDALLKYVNKTPVSFFLWKVLSSPSALFVILSWCLDLLLISGTVNPQIETMQFWGVWSPH
jgi:hypothetical protein